MPWLLMNTNMLPLAHASDAIGAFTFPTFASGRITELLCHGQVDLLIKMHKIGKKLQLSTIHGEMKFPIV